MDISTKQKMFYWAPRVLAILFAAFITVFALDVFVAGYKFPELIIALMMHLIPTALVATAIAVAWKWHDKGGIIFILLGLLYIALVWDSKPLIAYFTISGPSFLIGVLFLSDGKKIK